MLPLRKQSVFRKLTSLKRAGHGCNGTHTEMSEYVVLSRGTQK